MLLLFESNLRFLINLFDMVFKFINALKSIRNVRKLVHLEGVVFVRKFSKKEDKKKELKALFTFLL